MIYFQIFMKLRNITFNLFFEVRSMVLMSTKSLSAFFVLINTQGTVWLIALEANFSQTTQILTYYNEPHSIVHKARHHVGAGKTTMMLSLAVAKTVTCKTRLNMTS
jgi:hypothetical protein